MMHLFTKFNMTWRQAISQSVMQAGGRAGDTTIQPMLVSETANVTGSKTVISHPLFSKSLIVFSVPVM